jgi:hypothetical protein
MKEIIEFKKKNKQTNQKIQVKNRNNFAKMCAISENQNNVIDSVGMSGMQ